jgi:uncharacterized protein (DUF608 family)
MENKMWADGYYLNYYDDFTGEKSDALMGYQLDGEWAARFHGLEGVFHKERVPIVLKTIREKSTRGIVCGVLSFASPQGQSLGAEDKVAEYGTTAIFLPEIMILAMTYLYQGELEYGTELLSRAMKNIVCDHRHPWDLPNMILGSTGERHFGTDYYQNMQLWAVPAALKRCGIAELCRILPGESGTDHLIHRIMKAATPPQ